MANLSSDNLAAKQDEFASEQLKPVDVLYEANNDQVDFDAAQRIKLISVDVRKRIKAEMGKDEGKSLFRRALGAKNIDRMDESGRRKAFRAAFEAVYGRFLFEDDKALGKTDSEYLDERLGGVLKFPVDAKYGFKGRSELQAAVRRLAMVTSSSFVEADRDEENDTVLGEKSKAEKALERSLANKEFLESTRVDLSANALDNLVAEIDDIVAKKEKSSDVLYDLRGRRSTENKKEIANARAEVEVYFDQIVSLENQLRDIDESLLAANYSTGERLFIDRFLTKLSSFTETEDFDVKAWQEFLDTDLQGLLGKLQNLSVAKLPRDFSFHTRKVQPKLDDLDKISAPLTKKLGSLQKLARQLRRGTPTAASKVLQRYKDALTEDERTNGLTHHFQGPKPESADWVRDKEEFHTLHEAETKKTSEILFVLNNFAAQIKSVAENPRLGQLAPGLVTLCKKYLSDSANLNNPSITASRVLDFVNKTYKPFSIAYNEAWRNILSDADSSIITIQRDIADFDSHLAKSADYQGEATNQQFSKYIEKTKADLANAKKDLAEAKSKGKPQPEIDELEKRVSDLEKSLKVSPVQWVIDRALGGEKPGSEIKTLERKLREAQKEQSALQGTSEYFSNKDNLSVIGDSGSSLIALIGEVDRRSESVSVIDQPEVNPVVGVDMKLEDAKALYDKAGNVAGAKDLLGIIGAVTAENLKQAYRDMLRKYHPDKHGGSEIAREIFIAIGRAREILQSLIKGQNLDFPEIKDVELRDKVYEFAQALWAGDVSSAQLDSLNSKWLKLKNAVSNASESLYAKIEQRLTDLSENLKPVQQKGKSNAMKSILEAPFNTRIHKLKGLIESYTEQRKQLYRPSQEEMRKTLDANERSLKQQPENNGKLPSDYNRDTEKTKILDQINVDRDKLTGQIDEANEVLERLTGVKTKCEALKGQLATVIKHLKDAKALGVELPSFSDGQTLEQLETAFKAIEIGSKNFDPADLKKLFESFGTLFAGGETLDNFMSNFDAKLADKDKAVKTSKSALDKAKSGNAMLENLTDAQAAKKIIATLVAQQFPDMSLEDQYKMATAILAEDVATIQTTESYEKFAEKASADVLDTMQQAGFKGKLIGFKYKIGDKEEQPFKGLKPEDFADWPIMERHFKTGRFNHENGFFILAAMELFNGDVKSIQAVKTEKTLKTLIAKQLGVDERMDEAGISRIVDKAFDKQIEKVRPLVKSYFDHYDSNREEWESHSLRAIKLKLKALNQDRRTGKITDEVYAMKYEALRKEAEASGVLDKLGLAQNTVLASFANSPFSQWFRDRGYDFKERAKKKAAGFAWSTTKVAASGLWGATKFTAKLATKPITIPLKLAAKLGVGFVNLFRANKWQPEILQKKTAAETKSLLEKTKEVASGVVGTYAEDWKARTHDKTKFADRIEMGSDVLSSQADELAEKGKSTAVETTSPFIDLEEFKKQIAMIDAMKNAPASNDNKESKAA